MAAKSHAATALDDDGHTPQAQVPDMPGSYESYISSGLYDQRYPHPNRRTLRTMLRTLPAGGRFLDFGAGTGRYTLPLMEQAGANGVAYDVSPAACRAIAKRLSAFIDRGRLVVRDGEPAALAREYRGAFDLALLPFGVLGHVARRAERLRLLGAIHEMLKPDGVLILGLPNAWRRFRAEQRAAAPLVQIGTLEPGDVLYTRGRGADEIQMFYHLFRPCEVRGDLTAAGFRMESIAPESMLPERVVVGSMPVLGWLDDLACRIAPAASGYGFLIISRPEGPDAS